MQLYVVRHTHTNYNEQGLCSASLGEEVYLTARGLDQAENLSEELRAAPFEAIVSSRQYRTRQTAAIIGKHHPGLALEVNGRIDENRTGFGGMPTKLYYAALEAAEDKWAYKQGDGESLREVRQRVSDFVEATGRRNESTILVVTHSTIARMIIGEAMNLDEATTWDVPIEQGGFTVVEL